MAFFSSSETQVNLCPTRVSRIETDAGVSIFQEGMAWYRTLSSDGGSKRELDPISVEKWFARYCSIPFEKADPFATVSRTLKFSYVRGEPQTLLKSAGGDYEWQGLPFRSSALDKGLSEFEELPAVSPPGGRASE
ncbi:MAG: hypothetical protein HC902_12430 [Calothrix sp. SM1_5_4]|nr:hypothetical protein [Calothrix sp. SM1_5_4]